VKSDIEGDWHVAYWNGTALIDLGRIGGAHQAFAQSINDRDQIAGITDTARFFVHDGAAGTTSLLAVAGRYRWTFGTQVPTCITNDGLIFGNGFLENGVPHAYVLEPGP